MYKYIVINNLIVIPLFNLFIGIGLIAGFLILDWQIKKNKIPDNKITAIYLITVLIIPLGFLFSFLINYLLRFEVKAVRLTFYGGLLSGLVLLIIFSKIFKLKFFETINLLVPSVIIGHAIGRIGCFFAGCCFGKPTNMPWGVIFPQGSLPFLFYNEKIPIHPTQIYESLFLFILFFITISFLFENRIYIYLISYGIFRFLNEFLRGDSRGELYFITFLSPSQIISILIVVLGIALFIIKKNMSQSTVP